MPIRRESRREHLRILALRAPFAFTEAELMAQHLAAVGVDTGNLLAFIAHGKAELEREAARVLEHVEADTPEQARGRV